MTSRSRTLSPAVLVAFVLSAAGSPPPAAQPPARPSPAGFSPPAGRELPFLPPLIGGKYYSSTETLHIPFTLNGQEQRQLTEVQLYARAGTGEWVFQHSVRPDRREFVFVAPQDGEYGFIIVRIDRAGRPVAADLRADTPQLVVFVDTQPPEFDLAAVTDEQGLPFLRCEVRDASPNPATVRVETLSTDGTWRPVDAVPGRTGLYQVPDLQIFRHRLRVSASDLANNRAVREYEPVPCTLPGPKPMLTSGKSRAE